MKRVASDVMMANMATNAMKPKSLPKNNSAPDFGASKSDMNRPGNATERSNLGQNKVQPDSSDTSDATRFIFGSFFLILHKNILSSLKCPGVISGGFSSFFISNIFFCIPLTAAFIQGKHE
jgi:hypothetical protein